MTRSALTLLIVGLVACTGKSLVVTPARPTERPVRSCSYIVDELQAEPALLEVTARCSGARISGFSRSEPASAPFIALEQASAPWTTTREGWQFASAQRDAELRYRVDLEGLAHEIQRFDGALRVGHSLISPASTFLVQPEPLDVGVPIDLTVRVSDGEDFASGLISTAADSRHFRLQAHEASVATYASFGRFQRQSVAVGGSELEIVTADGKLDLAQAPLARWATASARAVAAFYGHFPALHAQLLVIPVPGRDQVLFGRLLPQSAPGVALLLGEHTLETSLYQDWVLVHELFHIGFPSFHDEARWLDEGSATYFEPIIRARAGYLTELEVWSAFARDMPRGLHAIEQEGLEHPSQFRSVYWSGAIACLLADVAARQRSQNRRGLEDGFRAVLRAGGDATQVWSLARVSQVIDAALGAPILQEIIAAHADRASPVELDRLLERLGVIRLGDGSVRLDDRAELAPLRHAITFGST